MVRAPGRVGLVAVGDDVTGPIRRPGHGAPLVGGREPGAAPPAQAGFGERGGRERGAQVVEGAGQAGECAVPDRRVKVRGIPGRCPAEERPGPGGRRREHGGHRVSGSSGCRVLTGECPGPGGRVRRRDLGLRLAVERHEGRRGAREVGGQPGQADPAVRRHPPQLRSEPGRDAVRQPAAALHQAGRAATDGDLLDGLLEPEVAVVGGRAVDHRVPRTRGEADLLEGRHGQVAEVGLDRLEDREHPLRVVVVVVQDPSTVAVSTGSKRA